MTCIGELMSAPKSTSALKTLIYVQVSTDGYSTVDSNVSVPSATAILYLFLSARPMRWKLDMALQQVLTPHEPETP